jgi:hypothetical protein
MEIQFIAPEGSSSAADAPKSRLKQIRSYARRAAHTKARRERMAEFQRSNHRANDRPHEERTVVVRSNQADRRVVNANPHSSLDSLRRDPFQCLAFRVNDVERVLIDYCKNRHVTRREPRLTQLDVTVFAKNPGPGCTAIIPADTYTSQVTTQLVPFAFADACLLNGLFLHAARRISMVVGHPQAEFYSRLALQYKIACIGMLSRSVLKESDAPSDKIIASSLFLTLDEVRNEPL